MPGEEPVGRPAPEAFDGRQGGDDVVVGELGEGLEVEVGVGELEDVLGLRAREPEREEVAGTELRDPLARRELPGVLVPHAVARDEVAAGSPRPRGGRSAAS